MPESDVNTSRWLTWTSSGGQRGADVAATWGTAIGYCLSASLLSIINKWAITVFPFPGTLTALQYLASSAGVVLMGILGFLKHDPLRMATMLAFLPAAICFYVSIFTNSELLLHANVDTFIVFRSAVPLIVAVGESYYLRHPWPSAETWLSLAVILAGALIYVLNDRQFALDEYIWALAYLVSMAIDFVYIKYIVMTIGLNTWGLVIYNNFEALLLYPFELLIMGEGPQLSKELTNPSINWSSFETMFPVALSCAFGLSISFFGFTCHKGTSATSFTVLGVVNKLLTVVVKLIVWDKHASLMGTLGLLTCIGGGIMYQQSTLKVDAIKSPNVVVDTHKQERQQRQNRHRQYVSLFYHYGRFHSSKL